jgi:4-hydroxy-2-oxoheptanedioate aldolase
MQLPTNRFKRAIAERRPQIGLWSQACHATVTELLVDARPDWVLIDTEHAPLEVAGVVDQLRVIEGTGVTPIVRPAWNDAVLFKRILDAGAQTLLVPYVQTVEEAERAVRATRYPPHGNRGVAAVHRGNRYGKVTGYHGKAASEICVLVQIETREGADALEAIAAVDGVDGVFIGPADLSAALGHLGDSGHPDVRAAIEDLCHRAGKAGTPIGILAPIEADAEAYFRMGFTFVAVASDLGLLRQSSDAVVTRFRALTSDGKRAGTSTT